MTCKNCKHTAQNELGDLICVNDKSENCSEFVISEMSCDAFVNQEYIANINLSMEIQ